jgi:hypothetical protein
MGFVLEINPVHIFYTVATLLLGCTTSPAAWADNPAVRAQDPVTHATIPPIVSIQNNPNFPDLHDQLQALVNTFGFHNTNRFCIITYASPPGDGDLIPYIYWPTQNKLIGWGTGSNPSIMGALDYYDLARDVLPDNKDLWSDYPHRSWVKNLIRDCSARGDWYTIKKTADGWVPIDKFLQFSSITTQLQYLADNETSQKTSNFCVIGQKDGVFLAAYVYWKTTNQLFLWLPDKYNLDDPIAVATADVQIDLKHDLRDEEDAEDQRNEMQRSYAEGILHACQHSGQTFTIQKSN